MVRAQKHGDSEKPFPGPPPRSVVDSLAKKHKACHGMHGQRLHCYGGRQYGALRHRHAAKAKTYGMRRDGFPGGTVMTSVGA